MRLCTSCSLAEQNRFDLVREFLDANGGGSVTTIAQQTGVSAVDVRRFLEGGRLVAIQGGKAPGCTCDGVGPRCTACRSDLSSALQDMHSAMTREQGDRAGVERGRGSDDSSSYHRRRRLGE
jgi:hypothetical protein